MKTYLELLEHCKNVKDWKYVYGAKGKKLTKEQIQSLIDQYPSCSFYTDVYKAGNVCCDCSGLISSCTGLLRSSQAYHDSALAIVPIVKYEENPAYYKGWAVWMKGHIGVADGEGGYYAMDGSHRDWVHFPIFKNNFTHLLKLKDIDYTVKEDNKDPSFANGYPHYRAHCQKIGWTKVCGEGGTAGTTGKSLRMEAIKIDYPGVKIHAAAHIQSKGDIDYGWITSDTIIGTVGEGKRMEALYLEGPVQFRVHVQGHGWTNWVAADKGFWLGTKGKSLRLEAVEIKRL